MNIGTGRHAPILRVGHTQLLAGRHAYSLGSFLECRAFGADASRLAGRTHSRGPTPFPTAPSLASAVSRVHRGRLIAADRRLTTQRLPRSTLAPAGGGERRERVSV